MGHFENFPVPVSHLCFDRDTRTQNKADPEQKNIAGRICSADRLGDGAYSAVRFFRNGGKALRQGLYPHGHDTRSFYSNQRRGFDNFNFGYEFGARRYAACAYKVVSVRRDRLSCKLHIAQRKTFGRGVKSRGAGAFLLQRARGWTFKRRYGVQNLLFQPDASFP